MADLLGQTESPDPPFLLRAKLIKNGYRPIPCNGKRPALPNWQNCHAADADLEGWTALNTGIVLGSNLVAVDVDVLDAHVSGELIELALNLGTGLPLVRAGKKPKTLLLYRTDTPIHKRKSTVFTDTQGQMHAVEILGEGQQFIAYGTHPDTGKPYQWLPETMSPLDVALCDLPVIDLNKLDAFMHEVEAVLRATGWAYKSKGNIVTTTSSDDTDDDLIAMLEDARPLPDKGERIRIISALKAIPASDRDDWLTAGMALHHAYHGNDDGLRLWAQWSKRSEKYDPVDQKRVWKSFGNKDSKVRLGTLFALAKGYDWVEGNSSVSRLSFLSPDDCENAPSRGYLIKNLIAPGDVGCIFGAPGAGKSLISPYLGYALAQGREAFGMRAKQGGVFYVAAEDSFGMRGRIKALKAEYGAAPDFTLVEGVSDLLTADSPDLAALKVAVADRKPAMIFIDTLSMAFPGLEENSAEAMGRVVKVARDLTSWGAAVILIHHDTKAEGSTPRGHSILNGALDMALHVQPRDEAGIIRGKLTKNRNGTCDRDIAFSIGTVAMGHDEDGDTITVAICNPLPVGHGGLSHLVPPKLSISEKAALSILRTLEAENIDLNRSISENTWREACIASRTVSASEEYGSRKKAFNRAYQKLVGHGFVSHLAGCVSISNTYDYSDLDGDGFDD